MAAPLCMKRMAKERVNLEKPNDDYFVFFEDDNLRHFYAYVVGPKGTLYEHKFVKLKFEIPDRYPLVPPKCTFIQHGGGRIHPNLYVDGKVCLSILGTWQGEPWALAMTIETVLITVRSLLDNQPYKHEPGQSDHPQFNKYVRYGTWNWLLLEYLKRENNPAAKAFLEKHVSQHRSRILEDLQKQRASSKDTEQLYSPYVSSGRGSLISNYPRLMHELVSALDSCCIAQAARESKVLESLTEDEQAASEPDQAKGLVTVATEIIDLYESDAASNGPAAQTWGTTRVTTTSNSKKDKQSNTEVIDLT